MAKIQNQQVIRLIRHIHRHIYLWEEETTAIKVRSASSVGEENKEDEVDVNKLKYNEKENSTCFIVFFVESSCGLAFCRSTNLTHCLSFQL